MDFPYCQEMILYIWFVWVLYMLTLTPMEAGEIFNRKMKSIAIEV